METLPENWETHTKKLENVFQRTLDKLPDNELNYLEKMTVSKMLLKQITDSVFQFVYSVQNSTVKYQVVC